MRDQKSEDVFTEIARVLKPELVDELSKAMKYGIEEKESVLRLAKKLLAEFDEIDDDICIAADYLQCQVDHNRNRQNFLEVLQYRGRLDHSVFDLRREFSDLRESLMQSLRTGKRTEQLDEILRGLSTIMATINQAPTVQPVVNLAGIETLLSPRCSTCSDTCRSSFRKLQLFVRKVARAAEQHHTSSTSNAPSTGS